jgi:Ca2+/H+ antiporter
MITSLICPAVLFDNTIKSSTYSLACGIVLTLIFGIYILSIAWAIARGRLTEPENLDDDSSDGDDAENDQPDDERVESSSEAATRQPLLNHSNLEVTQRRTRRSMLYHVSCLILGFLAICLSGFVLSHAAINITDFVGISDVVFGVIVLSIATTLPEKFVALVSGKRGRMGILVANTAGSNIFLLTLCLGTIFLDKSQDLKGERITIAELATLWITSMVFTLTVWFGARFHRWIGAAMGLGYILFLVLEATVIRDVDPASTQGSQ